MNRDRGHRPGEKSPTLGEAAAVMAALETYQKKLHPGTTPMARDLPEQLRELRESIKRIESVTNV